MEFVELSKQEYDIFSRKHMYRNYLNSANAFVLRQQYGFETAYVGVKENGELRCATGLVFVSTMKSLYAYAQRGFLMDYQDNPLLKFFTENLIAYLKEKNVIYLKMDPYVAYQEHDNEGAIKDDGFYHEDYFSNLQALGYIHQGFTKGFDANSQVRWMVVLSLMEKTEEDLMKQFDQQTRWSINKAMKLGVQVREMKAEELPAFKKVMDYASSTRNFDDMSIEHYEKQLQVYGDDAKMMMAYVDTQEMIKIIDEQTRIEEALLEEIEDSLKELPNSKKFIKKRKVQLEALDTCKKRKEEIITQEATYGKVIPIAVAYFVLYEDEIVYVSSGAYDEFRKYNGPYAIQWYMLNYAINNGYKRYNFYGTSGDFSKDADDHGVFEFKKGFHGVVEELIGEFVLPIQKGKYKAYKLIQNVKTKIR